jgi:hypothetical protein
MVRHMMILERGSELHLLEGMPTAWTKAGKRTELTEIPTSFGQVSLSVTVSDDGKTATIRMELPCREPLKKAVLHLEQFDRPIGEVRYDNGDLENTAAIVPIDRPLEIKVEFDN